MKKKTFALSLALGGALIASSLGLSKAFATKAEETDLTPNFDDDFSSCAIETADTGDRAGIGEKWTNAYFEPTGDLNEGACDKKQFYVTEDPKDATNKVLRVNTFASNGSFFYLTMKDVFVKDFKLSYDLYQTSMTNSPWTGFNCRKPVDGRYNGVNNVMMVSRLWSDDAAIGPQFYRCVGDSLMSVTCKGPNDEDGGVRYSSAFEGFTSAVNTWLHVEISAIGDDFSISINGNLLGKATIAKNTARAYGHVSLISCVDDAYYDNIHLENLDEEPYGASSSGDASQTQAPTISETSFEVNLGEDAVIPVNLYGEAISTLKQGKNEVLSQYYSVDGDKLTLSKDYLAKLGAGRYSFVLTTKGGSVGFVISVIDPSSAETPASSEASSSSSSEGETGKKSGCGGEIIGTSVVAFAALGGALALALKRKKDER